MVNGSGDERLLTQFGTRPRGHDGNQRSLAVGDLDSAGGLVGGVLDDHLNARERASGGRGLGEGFGVEEGGAAVLVVNDRAVGELGGELHETLDYGHCLFSLSVVLPGGRFVCRRVGGLVFGGGLCLADKM